MTSFLAGVAYHLPERCLSNDDLAALHPGWDASSIFRKTGVRERHICAPGETAIDLGYGAAEKLLQEMSIDRNDIDVVLVCTQTPDHFLPNSACLLQDRLGLPQTCAALDYNLGCSGFTYGLWLASALVQGGGVRNVLLITADALSRYCDPDDYATMTLFGDGAAAALITGDDRPAWAEIGPTVWGTDGRGGANLIVRAGCARQPTSEHRGDHNLFMNGPEIFSFALSTVKEGIQRLLDKTALSWSEVDHFLFHQANRFILDQLRATMDIPKSKLPMELEDCGNTSSSTIPLLLRRGREQQRFQPGDRCVLAGFGVGYSWAMTSLSWIESPACAHGAY